MSARQCWGFYCFSTSASPQSQKCPGATAAARPPSTGLGMQGCGGFTTRPLLPYGPRLEVCFNALPSEHVCWPQPLLCMETLCKAPALALRARYTFFQGVLAWVELGSVWDTHRGDPRSDTSMIYGWADHPQPALASPASSRASPCPWASKSLLLPQGGILA